MSGICVVFLSNYINRNLLLIIKVGAVLDKVILAAFTFSYASKRSTDVACKFR